MKKVLSRGLALLLAVIVIVSAISVSSFASNLQPKIANTGERGEVCTTFDGTTAPLYYSGTNAYSYLSTLSASSLKSALATLMTSTHDYISSYDDCHDYGYYTDCENGNSDYVCTLYTSYYVSEDGWVDKWNREHVWPQSLGGNNTSGGGADMHHIRPSESGVNSSRGNKKYGEAPDGSAVVSKKSGLTGGYSNGNYFEPLDSVKGDVARICLYVYVRWGSAWGADNITEVFESVEVLLEWCALDPVDTWEMERNDVVESVQGNRNVFIDYPEFAWMIFGKSVPANLTSPSDGLPNGTAGGGTSGGGSTPDVPENPTPEVPENPIPDVPGTGGATDGTRITFEFGANGEASHEDGLETSSYSETVGDYTLNLTSCSKVFKNAFDAKGNSALKLGTGKANASFSFETPDDVDTVILRMAGYKSEAGIITVNGKSYTVSTYSNNGAYTDIEVDTSSVKTVSVTVSKSGRAMLDSITYVTANGADQGGTTPDPEPDAPVTPEPEAPVTPEPNPGEDIGGGNGGNSGEATPTEDVVFELNPDKSGGGHSDSTSALTKYSCTSVCGNYVLTLSDLEKVFTSNDETGKGALKLGTDGAVGKFTFTVPENVNSVIIKVAKYKAKTTAVEINGTLYTITTSSNDGEYTEITVDTSKNKTVSVSTTSGGKRAMVDSITYVFAGGASGCEHDYNEYSYCKRCEVGFRTATLVLSADLALRYGVEVVNDELLNLGDFKMVYTFDGKTFEVTSFTIKDGYYVFTFDGIAPDQMTLNIRADFYIGDKLVATFDNYNVETNLLAIRKANSADKTLVQLVNDVLIYGSAAQRYIGKNTSDLAGDGESDVNASTAIPTDEVLMEGNNNPDLRFKGIGVHFDCVNYIYLKIYVSNPALFGSLTVDDKSYSLSDLTYLGNGEHRLNLDPVMPTEFGELLLFSLTGADGVTYSEMLYSVDCYATFMYNGGAEEYSPMYYLALALYRYGKSAAAYSLAHKA